MVVMNWLWRKPADRPPDDAVRDCPLPEEIVKGLASFLREASTATGHPFIRVVDREGRDHGVYVIDRDALNLFLRLQELVGDPALMERLGADDVEYLEGDLKGLLQRVS
jgi:hypothetical protein